ncbi:MAG: hypothetical protein EAX86_09795 [Candidatus Heimdallarchaeota archaeon]|nr:hypothetical protein [Candidatus Heimdallarchaeota archaeon]
MFFCEVNHLIPSIRPFKDQVEAPKQIEQIKHWLDLLGLEYVILTHEGYGGFNFLIPLKNCPDIHVALDSNLNHISFFSNGLTRLSGEPQETLIPFLLDLLRLQGQYFTSRLISTGSNDELRLFIGFRFDEMSMYRFSRKLRELMQFVKEIAKLIDHHKMNELWRDTEQEPKFPEIDVRERVRFL